MFSKIVGTTLLVLWAFCGHTQNLVPNGGFEVGDCPVSHSEIEKAIPWFKPVPSGTSDFFHTCYQPEDGPYGIIYEAGVPLNHAGSQQPHSGDGYAGFYALSAGYNFLGPEHEYREYVEVPLIEALVKGDCYYFEMYVCLADSSGFAISTLGAYFSEKKVQAIGHNSIFRRPQILNNSGIIDDTSKWVKISGNFIAEGGERYLTIGNFLQSSGRVQTPTGADGRGHFQQAYYYVDDILLEHYSYDERLEDTLICPGTFVSYDVSMDGATGYRWSFGEESPTVNITDAGYYYVDIELGGCNFRDDVNIEVFNRTNEPDKTFCSDKGELPYLDISANGDSFYWNDGVESPQRYFDTSGQYYVIITDQCGEYRDDIYIRFLDDCNTKVIAPNAFTPNGDGLNDGFKPYVINASKYELVIYNRWGEQIFRTEDINQAWDGTYKGKPCPQGTYLWIVNFGRDLRSGKINSYESGSVTLLR